MTRLATLIAALVAALTLTAAPAMGEPADSDNRPPTACISSTNTADDQPVAADGIETPCPPSPVQSAGDRPADRHFFQHKRSCKTEAKKWTRVVTITHELGTSANGASWWQQETRVGKWYRVYTPRGCQLRHNEWKRNHRGKVDGKAVQR